MLGPLGRDGLLSWGARPRTNCVSFFGRNKAIKRESLLNMRLSESTIGRKNIDLQEKIYVEPRNIKWYPKDAKPTEKENELCLMWSYPMYLLKQDSVLS